MLMTLVPLFDESMTVKAYSLFAQKNSYFQNTRLANQEAVTVDGLDVIRSMGLKALADDKEVFVPLSPITIYSRFEEEKEASPEKLVFLIDHNIPPEEMYLKRIRELKEKGYQFAIRKLEVSEFQLYEPILKLMDYIFLDCKRINISSARIFFGKLYPFIKLCAGNIDSYETFEKLREEGGYQFYEGPFYRMPVPKGQNEVMPLKINYIELLNMVNNPDYELSQASNIISRDTALALSLLKVVNRIARNSEIVSIKYAAAMLGQKELRRWINTVVVNQLCSEKPNEITRLSLLRAKFAENLASAFQLKMHEPELFLMGLFSVVDLILEVPMEKAMEMLKLSKEIQEVLIEHKGILNPVYELMIQYENANWNEVSRLMLLQHIEIQDVYEAYTHALEWYRDLFTN